MNAISVNHFLQNNRNLFAHPDFQVIGSGNNVFFNDLPNVDMDKMLVTVGKTKYIATDSLSCCLAFCSRGQQASGTPVLGLWHKTPLDTQIQEGLSILKLQMEMRGCDPRTIETFVIGGMPQDPDDEDSGSFEEEWKVVQMAERENIKGVLFNYSEHEDEPLSVVLTPKPIFISKAAIFDSSEANEAAGFCLNSV